MPTILDRLDIKIPSTVQGRSLNPLLSGHPVPESPPVLRKLCPSAAVCMEPAQNHSPAEIQIHRGTNPSCMTLSRTGEKYGISTPSDRPFPGSIARSSWISLPGTRPEINPSARNQPTRILSESCSLWVISTRDPPKPKANRPLVDPKDRIAAFERYLEILNRLSSGQVDPSVFEDLKGLRVSAPEIQGLDYLQGWAFELIGNLKAARETTRSR